MKRAFLCVLFVLTIHSVIVDSLQAAVPMSRFAKVIDSHTIVVKRIDASEVVHLANVQIPAEDEQAAREYLEEKLTGAWVYVEGGNVYRSPDALFINRELSYGAYGAPSLKMRVLGEINPGPKPQAKPTPVRAPVQIPRPRTVRHRVRRR